MDMADDEMLMEHKKTYDGFIRLILWSTAACAVSLALMAIFLT
jgi:hypothetical protein